MSRTLFGPVDATFAGMFLARGRAAGEMTLFGPGVDVDLSADATWPDVEAAPGGRPERLLVWLQYTSVPNWCWTAPVPIVGLTPLLAVRGNLWVF